MAAGPDRAAISPAAGAKARRRWRPSSRIVAELYEEMLVASRHRDRPPPCAQASRLGARCGCRDRCRAGRSCCELHAPARADRRRSRARSSAISPTPIEAFARLRRRPRHEPARAHAVLPSGHRRRRARCVAASGDHGGGRRQDRQRQCGGGILLRGVAAAAAAARAAANWCRSAVRLLALIEQVRTRGAPVNEYKVDLGTPAQSRRAAGRSARRAAAGAARPRRGDAAGAHHRRQDGPPAHASRRRALGDRARRHAGARDQESALRHPRRGAAAGTVGTATTTAR